MPARNGSDDSDLPPLAATQADDSRYTATADGGVKRELRLKRRSGRRRRLRLVRTVTACGILLALLGGFGIWLGTKAEHVRSELNAVRGLIPQLKQHLLEKDATAASESLEKLGHHTRSARATVEDPVWKVASAFPWIGPNFSAVSEMALSADDLVERAATPLVDVASSMDWKALTPVNGKFNVGALESASPSIASAANTVELTHTRLHGIDQNQLMPEVSRPLGEAVETLGELEGTLRIAADASRLVPSMLGSTGPRNYLVLVQNSAEVRATGGLPGALAVLRIEQGAIRLDTQASGASLGLFKPPIQVDPEQTRIYTDRLGKFISDVNLTPDFPTAAETAKAMWEERHGTKIDGVVAIDPVVLAHILSAAGPIEVPNAADIPEAALPRTLTGTNIVKTLLSDVYQSIGDNDVQDEYFAKVSQTIFHHIASGQVPGERLLPALTKSADEKRLHIWSDHVVEQAILARTALGGSVSGPSVGGASFGAYFNDGTGAKMDFHVKRTVQLVQECPVDGYGRTKVRVSISNKAPLDAATVLPKAVTGGGLYGIPAGTVQTNVVIYGPAQAQIETAHQDGIKTPFGSQLDGERPVGTVTTKLRPGQSTVVEFVFGKIVQHDNPVLSVTPTVEPVEDVAKATILPDCPSSTTEP